MGCIVSNIKETFLRQVETSLYHIIINMSFMFSCLMIHFFLAENYIVGTTVFIVPSALNSILSMHTSRLYPAAHPSLMASGRANLW